MDLVKREACCRCPIAYCTDHTAEIILQAGERILNIEKLFNLNSGILSSEDKY